MLIFLQGESGKERQVQCLQFPCSESGCELPANTLLTFLDAVGQCCFRGKSKKPGTLLSHSRCRRQMPHVNLGYGSKGSLPRLCLLGFICGDLVGLQAGLSIKCLALFFSP